MIQAANLPRGPVMIDVAGFSLTAEERSRLLHPLVGGVILFRRNFENISQLTSLIAEIRQLRTPHLLVAVDHEGGRVQRFIEGFTRLPSMATLGKVWQSNPEEAKELAEMVGYVLAAELRACGVDFSFTPVLDLDWGRSAVIGDRSFAGDPMVVSELAIALQQGLARGGMGSCGKHFPGHGWVEADSHHEIPQDERTLEQMREDDDIQPFARMIRQGMPAIMPAHVIYPSVDSKPAGFSEIWLRAILRGELRFDGVIFSDDLCMEGAAGAGTTTERANAAFTAGCDMVLVCNHPNLADELLTNLVSPEVPWLAKRLHGMVGEGDVQDWQLLLTTEEFRQTQCAVAALTATQASRLSGPSVGETY